MEASKEFLVGTLDFLVSHLLRLVPIANIFSSTLTSLRFNRDAISRLYKNVNSFKSFKEISNRKHSTEPFVHLK